MEWRSASEEWNHPENSARFSPQKQGLRAARRFRYSVTEHDKDRPSSENLYKKISEVRKALKPLGLNIENSPQMDSAS